MTDRSELWRKVSNALYDRYENRPPLAAIDRLEAEKAVLSRSDIIACLELVARLRKKARESDRCIRVLHACGGFYTSYLLGATDLDPLPPHYFCKSCGSTEFVRGKSVCRELPPKTCACGAELWRDGFGLPFGAYLPQSRSADILLAATTDFLPTAEHLVRELAAELSLDTETDGTRISIIEQEQEWHEVERCELPLPYLEDSGRLLRRRAMDMCIRYSDTKVKGRTYHRTRSYADDHIDDPTAPAFSDDIFTHVQSHMLAHGYTDSGFAYSVMVNAAHGLYGKNGMDETTRQSLLDLGIAKDYIDILTDIRYLPDKYQVIQESGRLRRQA